MESVLVNVAGLALMAAIVWWFWLPGSDNRNRGPDKH